MPVRSFVAMAGLALLASGSAVALHNHLTKSAPAEDEVLAAAPRVIRLWFSEKPEPAFSSITLLGADSAKVEVGKAEATDDTLSVSFAIKAPLSAGAYQVRWRTAGKDGHAVRGTYRFSIKP